MNRPAIVNSSLQAVGGHAELLGPRGNALRSPFVKQEVISASVPSLFFERRPPTIARLVIPVIVDAVDFVFLTRGHSHVSQKGRKGISPLIADDNSAPAVICISLALRIVASVLYVAPRSVLLCFRQAVRPIVLSCDARSVAATANGQAASQAGTGDYLFFATVALAKPLVSPVDSTINDGSGVTQHDQFSKSLADDVLGLLGSLWSRHCFPPVAVILMQAGLYNKAANELVVNLGYK